MASAELEAVVGADQVRSDQPIDAPLDPGEHRRLRRALDDRVDGADTHHVLDVADVAMDELHGGAAKPGHIQLRPSSVQVVERNDLPSLVPREKPEGEVRHRRIRRRR